ncbi:vanomycin resistance protein VanB [Planomonospora parontospora subsp. parontospora]|uniref:Vanomycin resistance protein VanB n=3 Tax=Planomonospora parontospora TaxID=58119 RepID=A0AA37F2D2_9ACTN|nr:vanomycin resistance protein VanB [Planomonospora parontospora]GII07079.1 vanomycin resistance protein VanB [Planomonospora parontospora subsp. parontospora]
MRNAGRPTEPPTDPFAAVPLPSHPVRPGAAAGSRDPRRPAAERPGPAPNGAPNGTPGAAPTGGPRLPPGVSPDIFGPSGEPAGFGRTAGPAAGGTGLPQAASPPQPWRMAAPPPEQPIPPRPPQGGPGDPSPAGPPGREERAPRGRSRRLLLVTVLLLVLAALAYAVPAVAMSGKILSGTRVRGVDIGGLTATEAADRLRERLAERAGEPMVLTAFGKRHELDPEKAGLELDVVATIDQAPSDFPTPGEVWRALTGTTELDPRHSVDSERLDAAVAALAEDIDREVVEGAVRFKGVEPVTVKPRDGRELEKAAAAAAIQKAYLGPAGPVELPVTVIKPKVTAAVVAKTAASAGKALSGPITLKAGARQAVLPVETVAAHLSFEPGDSGGMRPVFDARKAVATVEKDLVDQAQAPREPTFRIVGGKPELVPGRKGRGVDDKKLAAAVAELVSEGGSRTIPVSLTTVRPRTSEAELRKLGIKEKISEFTTPFECCPPRVTNIRTIAKLLDGHLVKPGETFSLNGVVGERDTARGFVEAPMIAGGRLVPSVGGGISQFVTTMYNAVFFGGLQDVQHMAHEFYISRYPAGRESTVSWPAPDFRWKNDSPYGVLVKTSTTSTSVTVAFWSTKRYEIESISSERYNVTPFERKTDSGPDCIPMVGQQGFTIDVTRVFKKDGKEVKRETEKTVYKPETDLKCVASTEAPTEGD